MLANSFLTIFFRLINIAALVGLGYFLFKKYIKNKIEEKISQKETVLKGLEEQGYFLEGKAHELQKRYAAQEEKIAFIKEKINEWNTLVAIQEAHTVEENKLFRAKALKRIEIQYQNRLARSQYLEIVPQAIANAQIKLQHEFSEPTRNYAFTQDIVHHLNQEIKK